MVMVNIDLLLEAEVFSLQTMLVDLLALLIVGGGLAKNGIWHANMELKLFCVHILTLTYTLALSSGVKSGDTVSRPPQEA